MTGVRADADADADADAWGAFVPGSRARARALGRGPLDGLRLAVKDLIDVEGVTTTGGNPDWTASHGRADRHAPVVLDLLRAGAILVGKTVTDELAFSLEGENAHHGTPCNPAAPHCLPGGSSSGSAVAVAAGMADIALGTDTGGSVRIPAAFCGVYGMRPTHGLVSVEGVVPFAPSYDCVGWMAADGRVLAAAGDVLLPPCELPARLHLYWADDIAALAHPTVRDAVRAAADAALPMSGVKAAFDGPPAASLEAYTVLQGNEIRRSLGAWIAERRPRFGARIAARFAALSRITDEQVARCTAWRAAERERLRGLLGSNGALVFPTAACTALPRGASDEARGRFYETALAVNAIAGHAGLPQVTLPCGRVDGAPVGLSIVGPPGSDSLLLALATAWPRPIASAP